MVKTVGKYDLYGTLGEGAFGKYVLTTAIATRPPSALCLDG